MAFTYEQIEKFMLDYFPAYSYKGQIAETQAIMKEFYDEDIIFDDGFMRGCDNWLKLCLTHPKFLDVITPEKLCIDVKNQCCSAMVTARFTQPDGSVISEVKMNAFYTLGPDAEGKIKMKKVNVYAESNIDKLNNMMNCLKNGR